MAPPEKERLLLESEEEGWNNVEEGALRHHVTVQGLIERSPETVLHFIKTTGVAKLGQFEIQDEIIFAKLGGHTMLTMGADTAVINYERKWTEYINSLPGDPQDTGWSRLVTVEAYVVNIRKAAAAGAQGLLQPILMRWQSGACHWSVFSLPAVQAVVQFKWDTWGSKVIKAECLVFLTWLVSFTTFMLIFQDEDLTLTLRELLSSWAGVATVVAELVALMAMIPFLIVEICSMVAYTISGWFNIWNALDVATYSLQIGITVFHLGRISLTSGALSAMAATQCVLLWFKLNYFSRMFGPARLSFVDGLRQVMYDIRFYMFFLLLMMWGFACSYCILFRQDQEYEQFANVGRSLLTMFKYARGGVDMDLMLKSHNPTAALCLSIVYQFTMTMVLMNMLIGVMCSSINRATQHEDMKLVLSKAQMLDELETTVPKFMERLLMKHYYPTYVHVLRVCPKSMDPLPDESQLWRKQKLKHQHAAAAAAGDGEDVKALLAKVDSLQQQVQKIDGLQEQVQALTDLLNNVAAALPDTSPAKPAKKAVAKQR